MEKASEDPLPYNRATQSESKVQFNLIKNVRAIPDLRASGCQRGSPWSNTRKRLKK